MSQTKLNLNNVTLVAIDGRSNKNILDILISAAKCASKNIKFKNIKIISGERNPPLIDGIEFYHKKISSIKQYNEFILKGLINYIDTEYCIIYQSDGFIIDSNNWREEFLEYDYIGAPWNDAEWNHGNRVGNGGFSLRSKKLLKQISLIENLDYTVAEDLQICVNHKDNLELNGIKFCPPQLASFFSVEHQTEFNSNTEKSFGFHGSENSHELIDRTKSIVNNLLKNE
jgi:hypothetical protein